MNFSFPLILSLALLVGPPETQLGRDPRQVPWSSEYSDMVQPASPGEANAGRVRRNEGSKLASKKEEIKYDLFIDTKEIKESLGPKLQIKADKISREKFVQEQIQKEIFDRVWALIQEKIKDGIPPEKIEITLGCKGEKSPIIIFGCQELFMAKEWYLRRQEGKGVFLIDYNPKPTPSVVKTQNSVAQ